MATMVDVVCANPKCGKQFQTGLNKFNANKYKRFFCCRECGWQDQIGRERPDMKGRTGWGAGLTKETDERVARMSKAMRKEAPDKELLSTLYVERNLTLKEIGQRFDVTQGTVKRWVDESRLVRKRDTLTGEIVSDYLESGLTRVQIAAIYNCSPEFVSIVAKKAGIRRTTAGVDWHPEPEELRSLYWDQQLNHAEIGRIYGVTPSAIGKWFQRFEIPLRDNNTYGQCHTTKDGHSVRSRLELLVDDWLYSHSIKHEYEPYIHNGRFWADFLVNGTYIEVWGMMDKPSYRQRQAHKVSVYKSLGLNLLSVYPHDFPDLKVLSVLLPK